MTNEQTNIHPMHITLLVKDIKYDLSEWSSVFRERLLESLPKKMKLTLTQVDKNYRKTNNKDNFKERLNQMIIEILVRITGKRINGFSYELETEQYGCLSGEFQ